MANIEILILITFLAEVIELLFFYSPILGGSLVKSYNLYKRSPFLLFSAHTGYIWLLIISIAYSNLSLPLIIAIALKTLDIFTKVELIKSVFIKQSNSNDLNELLNIKIPFWMYALSICTYPYLVYLAFS